MNTQKRLTCAFYASFVSVVAAFAMFGGVATPALAAPVTNVVLVHGAWVDGSGWKPVYDILKSDGYNVTIVQIPETSFEHDIAATKRMLDLQRGPLVLVGHSYGGSIISQAGVYLRHPDGKMAVEHQAFFTTTYNIGTRVRFRSLAAVFAP